jgi:FtsP/CotA-like multicopper oxidase with cupredoxin domain
MRNVLTVNGQYPGPIIRMNRGDRLLVNVINNLPNATSLHWHGMFQNGTNWMDGTTGITQCPIPPGQSFQYNFTVENQYGSYWWHAHYETQYVDGINGPLIIHAPEEAEVQKLYDYDQVVILQDWYHVMASSLLPGYLASGTENVEPVPDSGLIQGTNYFNCSSYDEDNGYECSNSSRQLFSFQQNKRYRLRFINTSAFTPFSISVDNHTLDIVEVDGTAVNPYPIHRFEIATAERYSAILTLNQSTSTNYWFRASMNTNCYAAVNPVLDPNVLAVLTYTNSTSTPTDSQDWADAYDLVCQDLNSTLLIPSVVEQAPTADVLYELQFSFAIGANALDRAIVNGTTWLPSTENPTIAQAIAGLKTSNASSFDAAGTISSAFSANQFVISLSDAKVVDVIVTNFDDGSHPFHLHGHAFWIMATSQDQYFPWDTDLYSQLNGSVANSFTTNPLKRDTLVLPAYSWALIRFRNDNAGLFAFHCHNNWHFNAGLAMQFLGLPDIVKTWTLPEDVAGLCTTE